MSESILLQQKKIPDYPLSQYNLVVQCYNHNVNRVDEYYFSTVPESATYRFIYQMMTKPFSKVILVLSLIILPIINIVLYILIWYCYIYYKKCYQIYIKNRNTLGNPFQNMIYSTEICTLMNKHFWFFSIQMKDISGLTLNYDMMASLKNRSQNGLIKFMVYDDLFYKYYKQFTKLKSLHKKWIFISTICLILSGLLIYILIYFFNQAQIDDDDFI